MPRYKLGMRYDGSRYHGFQSQNNAQTIEGDLEATLFTYFREEIDLIGSSRTDRGVHALENTAHFDFHKDINSKDIYHLNSILDEAISILYIDKVEDDFHARFDAKYRSYSYYIHNYKDPILNSYSYYYPYRLDTEKLIKCSEIIRQYKDFSSFSKVNSDVHHYECEILESRWEIDDHKMCYHVIANRFLRGMVRALVASQLALARDYWNFEEFISRLENPEMSSALFSAPGKGLFLNKVSYQAYKD